MDLANFQSRICLSEEEKQTGFWVQDDVHLAHAVSPLFASFQLPAMTEGTKIAFENLKMPISQFVMKLSDGRIYQATLLHEGNLEQRVKEHQAIVEPLLPRLKPRMLDYVESEFMPFYARLEQWRSQPLTLAEARENVAELFQFYQRAWQLHFEIVIPRGSISMALEQSYGQLAQDPETTAVYRLLTGVMNKTLETDQALWKLAVQVQQSAALAPLFSAVPAAELAEHLTRSEEGRAFLSELYAFLEEYGYRTANSHEFVEETWVENPAHALAIISAYIEKEFNFDQEFAQTVAEREAKVRQVLARMPEGEGKKAFIQLHQDALDSWGLDEDHHFYIDAMLPAKARLFLLHVGEMLAEQDVFRQGEDIFFLYLDELMQALSQPVYLYDKVKQRREEHEANKRKQVPPFYGTPPQGVPNDPMLERVFGSKTPEVNESERKFAGYGASQGVYTGVVKVVRGPEDFAKIEKGDVLVCKTTTPPWTVLFSVAGAVVTDAGGILSHAATVAREYKLPSVVGTKVATAILRDGDVVTVDGSNGVVTFGEK
ncbi:PEP-utilizing enzyme [Brevibacillus sp. H7]|uniref:PEP-utilizing enzyme n=1 Tax=Brevibacillus sp. H7 TaxID=3349138 RepID=UPI0037F57D37